MFLDFTLLGVHALVFYAWVAFPALLAWAARIRVQEARRSTGGPAPSIAIIVSAYNEEGHIADRVRNLLEMDYPPDRWRAFIGVDGSKDRTAERARTAAGSGLISVVEFAQNRGKVSVLKDLVALAQRGEPPPEILVFTDANTMFEPPALLRLVAPFSDSAVGGVCGKLLFVEPEGGKTDENVYWTLENRLKAMEGAIDSCLGANGAIYAIRSSLFWSAIPANTIIDDFVIAMKVRERGLRVVYEPQAVAVEELPPEVHQEWKRRVRIGAGDFQALWLCRRCLYPSQGLFAWSFWSHKVLRWFTPHLMILGFLLAVVATQSTDSATGRLFLSLYAILGAAALLGSVSRRRQTRLARTLRRVQYLLAIQAALFAGFLLFCRGNLTGNWQRTTR
jgi:cellulose synthase/poly-beta-1,6-N-acetylglucosamine synthase-like glycosyltransferase